MYKPQDVETEIETAIFSLRGIISAITMLELHLENIEENPGKISTPTNRIVTETIGSIRDHIERVERDLSKTVNAMCQAGQSTVLAQPADHE